MIQKLKDWWEHTKTIQLEWISINTTFKGDPKGIALAIFSIGFHSEKELLANERFTLFFISVYARRFTFEVCNILLRIFFNKSRWVYSIKIPFRRFMISNMFKEKT